MFINISTTISTSIVIISCILNSIVIISILSI